MPAIAQWLVVIVLIASAMGVILAKKPVYASLSFLLTLFSLALLYLGLSAPFIATMQLLIYAGAILVIFMFVIILFQDAHLQIMRLAAGSSYAFLAAAMLGFLFVFFMLGMQLIDLPPSKENLSPHYGTVQSLGNLLYRDYFFPFEVLVLPLLVAVVGTLYVGKKER